MRMSCRGAVERSLRGNIQNAAHLVMLQAVIYKQLAEMEDGFQIDIHHQIPVLRADLGDVAAQPDPGVIHQNVGFAQSVDTGGKQIFPALLVRDRF